MLRSSASLEPFHQCSFLSAHQADGCVLVKTKQAVLVAEYVAPVQAPEATPVVEGLADYLISVQY
jgi:profilin